jgi:MerR family transcriptional regulator, copper efflux regulator
MRISEAAARLGMSPRMLRYREDLGLLPPVRERRAGRGATRGGATQGGAASRAAASGAGHRQYTEENVATIAAALRLEQRYDITPAALAFGLRVLTEPSVRAAVADLGRRTGHVPATPGPALDFEKERALRWLGAPAKR